MSFHIPIIYKDATHRPLGSGEFIEPTKIPLSPETGNLLRANADGLYAGAFLQKEIYYVDSAGVDAPNNGSKLAPLKTLDYTLALIAAQTASFIVFTGTVVIALKAGQTFPMTASMKTGGDIILTFWGDPQYGDFNSPVIGTGASPSVMADLQRPIIAPTVDPASFYGINGFRLYQPVLAPQAAITLQGVQVNLPAVTTVGNSDYSDFIVALPNVSGRCNFYGSVCNMLDANAPYGLFGLHARALPSFFTQYASQFMVEGAQVVAGASTASLLARQWFLKFYPDFDGNNQTGGHLVGGSGGSSIMQVQWTDTPSQLVVPGKSNQATYPLSTDPAMGLRNYFYRMTRDQQSRPLNVVAPFLLP